MSDLLKGVLMSLSLIAAGVWTIVSWKDGTAAMVLIPFGILGLLGAFAGEGAEMDREERFYLAEWADDSEGGYIVIPETEALDIWGRVLHIGDDVGIRDDDELTRYHILNIYTDERVALHERDILLYNPA